MKILLATPFFGDFGHHIIRWIPHLRFLKHKYDSVCAWAPRELEYLYSDFCTPIEEVHPNGDTCGCDADITVIQPGAEYNRANLEVRYHQYGHKDRIWISDLVVHARADYRETIGENRNWPVSRWTELVQRLRENNLVRTVICIGSREAAYNIPGARDMRGVDSRLTCDILASTRLCIGPSSGPMHLASLCHTPHLVWTDTRKWNLGWKKGTNRERYQSVWNPLATPVTVIDSQGWQPEVDVVYAEAERVLR